MVVEEIQEHVTQEVRLRVVSVTKKRGEKLADDELNAYKVSLVDHLNEDWQTLIQNGFDKFSNERWLAP